MRYRTFIQLVMILGLVAFGLPAGADSQEQAGTFAEARMEGQIWATFALNRHLNPFKLKVAVDNDTAILEGQVDESVKKELAEQIALSVDGIDKVDNRIEVVEDLPTGGASREPAERRTFGDRVSDATTTASVKSKLLWNQDTAGLAINVTTENGVVTLEGKAESEASKDLAEQIAANTDGVRDVVNNIQVKSERDDRAN